MAKITAAQVKELRDKTSVGMMDAKNALVHTDGDMDGAIDYLREKGVSKAAKKADRIAAEGLASVTAKGNEAAIVEINSETDFVAKNEKFQKLVSDITETIAKENPSDLDAAMELPLYEGTIGSEVTSATSTIGEKITFRRFAHFQKNDNEVFGDYSHMGGQIVVLAIVEGASQEVARNVAMHVAASNPQFLDPTQVSDEAIAKEKEIFMALNEDKIKGKPENIVENMVKGRINKFLAEASLVEQAFVKNPEVTVGKLAQQAGATIVSFVRFEVGEGIDRGEVDFAAEVAAQLAAAKK